jgi:predicted lipoprotein
LRAVLNTFPSDTAQILTNVQSGAWDLNLASNIDARGFPALDFLLFRLGNDSAATLARFLAPADSAHLQGYVAALVTDVASVTSSIYQQWTNGYSATFKASLGTDVGSSTSLIVNEMNRDLEILKTASIGIPLGKQSFDTPLPDKVEGFYSGMSKSLAIAQLTTVRHIYNGEADGTPDGVGLKEALDAVEAEYNGGALTDAIAAQFVATAAALQALPEPLSGAVVTNRVPVETAYAEVQKLVVLLKADLASALSILITYTDADGD